MQKSDRGMGRFWPALAVAGFWALACSPGAASTLKPEAEQRSWHATVYAAKWAHDNLGNLPRQAARGDLEWWDQYFVGAGLSRVLLPGLPVAVPILQDSQIELEGQYLHHFGEMDYPEVTLAFYLRSPDLALPGELSVNAAFGQGLSYAFKEPLLESARKDRAPQKLLAYLAFELELSHDALPNMQLVPRLHHRSGAYGVIGPRGDGSNYMGLGVRVSLP